MLKYDYDIRDSIGGRKEQQDYSGVASTKFGFLMVVCDGMGGAKGGSTASKMAVNIIINGVANSQITDAKLSLKNAIQQANFEIHSRSTQDPTYRGMGTTVTALLLQDESAIIAHVGDSRVYHLRNGKKIYRTFDHSKVFEMVKRGIMDEETARTSSESNVILRALGIKPHVDIDIIDGHSYQKGDLFLLCTDGICGAVPEEQFLSIIKKSKDFKKSLIELTSFIDNVGFSGGGNHDNLTAGIIECLSDSKIQPPLDMKSKIIISVLSLLLILSLIFSSYQVFEIKNLNLKLDSLTSAIEKNYIEKSKVEKLLEKTGKKEEKASTETKEGTVSTETKERGNKPNSGNPSIGEISAKVTPPTKRATTTAKKEEKKKEETHTTPEEKKEGENDSSKDTKSQDLIEYKIKAGDTMAKIARKNGISLGELIKINNGKKEVKKDEIIFVPQSKK